MNKSAFYDSVRSSLFAGRLTQGVVDTLESILASCDNYCITDYQQKAYILGTAKHESYHPKLNPQWEPVREGFGSHANAIATVTALFKAGKISKNYALPAANGQSYYGRGFVQTTHLENYEASGRLLNLNLRNNPDLLLKRPVAADNLVLGMKKGIFTGKRLSDYFNGEINDSYNARRIVNGLDQAARIAGYADKFYIGLILK